jgi:hypothetical protein
VFKLLRKPFVEGQSGCLRTRVANILSLSNEGRHACHGHDMTVVLFDHGRKEFSHKMEVRENVDIEDPFRFFGWLVYDEHAIPSAGIVD